MEISRGSLKVSNSHGELVHGLFSPKAVATKATIRTNLIMVKIITFLRKCENNLTVHSGNLSFYMVVQNSEFNCYLVALYEQDHKLAETHFLEQDFMLKINATQSLFTLFNLIFT